jgi:glycosyltransferase involved in cell wall biosynthesis
MEYVAEARVPVIVDQQNVDRLYWQNRADHSPFPTNIFARWNVKRTASFEDRMLPKIWAYVSVSDDDRRQTRMYAEPHVQHFWIAPNGVDTRRFAPRAASPTAGTVVTLGYLGSMDLQMNIDAVQRLCAKLLPEIRVQLRHLDVRLLVVGRNPPAAIQALANETPGMTLSGTVDDVVPWLHRIDILVCPLRVGAGTKLKVVEGMSAGLPVVGSPLAFAGIQGRQGDDYVIAQDDDAFIQAICQLARAPDGRRTMGTRARQLVQREFEWSAIVQGLAEQIRAALMSETAARTL